MSGTSQKTGVRSWTRGGSRWIPLLLAVVTLAAMGRLAAMDFTWRDDDETIHQNPRMNPPTWQTVNYYWTHAHKELYVPVTYMVWAGLAAIARVPTPDDRGIALNPWVFHTANVLVHVGNTLIVYAILRRVVKNPWAAGVGAMVFGAHPVQVETVGWVSGMKDLLYATCVLGAVWNYVVYAEGRKEGEVGDVEVGRQGAGRYWVAMGLTVLGTLCKPTAVVTPVLLAVLDRWVVGRDWRRVARDVGPFVLAVAPCVMWTKVVQYSMPRGPMWSRPLVAMDALAFYLRKLAWPARLVFDYGHDPEHVIKSGEIFWTWVIPAAVAMALWAGRRRRPVLVAAGLVFVAGLLPVLGLTPFKYQRYSTTADHYLYLSMLGVAMALAWVVARWPGRRTAVAVVAVACVLTVRSALQAGYWADDVTLNRHRLEINPDNYLAHYNLAIAMEFRARAEGSEELREEAIAHLREAIRLKPDIVLARSSLGTILMGQGRTEEGVEMLREAAQYGERLAPEDRKEAAPAHFGLGLWLSKQGRYTEALNEYRAALQSQPGSKPIAAALAAAEARVQASGETRPATTRGALERGGDSSKVGAR